MRLVLDRRCGHYGLTIGCLQVALASQSMGEKRWISFEWTEQLDSPLTMSVSTKQLNLIISRAILRRESEPRCGFILNSSPVKPTDIIPDSKAGRAPS
ncbi:hypothetical protein CEXT_749901 [Caerostris extrusa]|uniref:Uncharacterized protein n=1 Tax=Caerostris extrusa TaxID=172846 RepID=A0AAV4XLR5_CAEEX|nr:hypothetical protein CEXT_749901 [Caerostris extrusa]